MSAGTTAPPPIAPPEESQRRLGLLLRDGLSFRNIGAVYVLGAIIVIFSIWVPGTFLTWATVVQILDTNAVTALLALALIIPLSARVFDLSIGNTAALSGVAAAYFLAHGVGVVGAVALAMVASLLVGIVNGIVVVVMNIDSFIGTLATGSVISSFTLMITNGGTPIDDPRLAQGFADIGQLSLVHGITLPVLYVLVVAVLIWWLQDHTGPGRRIYATGFNTAAARLAQINVDRIRFLSLIASAVISGAGGIALASSIGAGDPTSGPPYLLGAYTAAFLGAAQLRAGRFNAWGALIAVLLVGTGSVGLGLAGTPVWAPTMFVGVVLIAALAITGAQRRGLGRGWRRRPGPAAAPPASPAGTEPAQSSTDLTDNQ